jgi:dinuclear metal center YbgI/SA1388 family protein
MKIQDLIHYLETVAPPALQEDYDNAGLIVGDKSSDISGVLVCLDCIEAVVDEAILLGCNIIVAHHPIVFRGLKRFNGKNYVERTIIKAIKHDIAIYAIHTNLDNVHTGVNDVIANKIGLQHKRILSPKRQTLRKIVCYVPDSHTEAVCDAMHSAGGGQIGQYKDCSFRSEGMGTFTPSGSAQPYSGAIGTKSYEKETRIEMIFAIYDEAKMLSALHRAHPYEEIAYYIYNLENVNQEVGSGMIGSLAQPMSPVAFMQHLKSSMDLHVIKHTAWVKDVISTVAVCGGSGSFLTHQAIVSGADVYITADYKYHEFFDADDKMTIIDIGHYESEKYTIELLYSLIIKNFSTFATHYTKVNTNPIQYF